MSKSRFAEETRGNGRWDEEEHPRGKDGRFASGGSSSVAEGKEDNPELFDGLRAGDSVWITQKGEGEVFKVKSFYREKRRFSGGYFTLIDKHGREVGADSAFVNKFKR